MIRAIVPLVALLALIALVISSLASLNTMLSPNLGASTTCKLGPLRVNMETSYRNNSVIVDYVIQPPNPCYKVESVTVQQTRLGDNEADIALVVRAAGPGPGRMCIQVLPPPVTGEVRVNVPKKPSLVKINMELTLVLDNGSTEHYSCTALLKGLAGEP